MKYVIEFALIVGKKFIVVHEVVEVELHELSY